MAATGGREHSFRKAAMVLFVFQTLFRDGTANSCVSKETCRECIAQSPVCAWCWDENLSESGAPRCDYKSRLLNRKCKNIANPEDTLVKLKDLDLSNKGAKEDEAIQLKPQEIKIRLRPNSIQQFAIEFRQAVDYPVDLYYLMDLSKSMEDDKQKLAQLGNKLADEMGNITSNFRLGFGSFVDKTTAPYVDSNPDKLEEPCQGCVSPYGFRNNMPLSLKTYEFARKVEEAPISGNLDAPEGGFDAIMQAAVCQKEIGWRNKSRKLLVYSTDNSYHYAGDGKLGGIITPNDERCHLDDDGLYTMSKELDYPSLSQINRQIREHKINIIFAVTSDQVDLYEKLSRRLTGSTTGKLDTDSANVVDLVRKQYDEIKSSVVMMDDTGDSNIRVNYYSKCLGTKMEKRNDCRGLKVETSVTFHVELEFAFCPQDRSEWNRTFHISPVGLQDQLTVHLEMLCECDCEKPWNEEAFSPKCSNGNGTFECGICSCNQNRYGKECECDDRDTNPFSEEDACFFGNDSLPCSGLGTCRCGQCDCRPRQNPDEKIYGKFCECDNYSCDMKDGIVCSGPDHGMCDCGVCKCHKGWKGEDCSCSDNIEKCIGPDGKECSGHGRCECGQCVCEAGDQEYFGTYCDDCPTCPGICNELRACAECWLKNHQKGSNATCSSCGLVEVRTVDAIEVKGKEKQCLFKDEEDCHFTFKYAFVKDSLTVYIKKTKDCPTEVNIMAISTGVAGGVVATGLFLLMLWKILTTIHDRRELARFEKDKLLSKWQKDDNPLYIQATSTFQNPAYKG